MYRKVESRKVYPRWCAGIPANELPTTNQWFFFRQNIRKNHPANYLFSLSKKIFSGSKYHKKIFCLIMKTEALLPTPLQLCTAKLPAAACPLSCYRCPSFILTRLMPMCLIYHLRIMKG